MRWWYKSQITLVITPTSTFGEEEKTNSLHEMLSLLFLLSNIHSFVVALPLFHFCHSIMSFHFAFRYLSRTWCTLQFIEQLADPPFTYPPPRTPPRVHHHLIYRNCKLSRFVSHSSIYLSTHPSVYPFVSLDYCQKRWLLHKSVNA